jgi:hypothetical protein
MWDFYDPGMSRPFTLQYNRIVGLCAALGLSGCAVIGEVEYKEFTPVPVQARQMNEVRLTWEVREDVADYCLKASPTRGHLWLPKPVACAVWITATRECKVVTGPNPNHVVLGHEVRHCFEGHFHR